MIMKRSFFRFFAALLLFLSVTIILPAVTTHRSPIDYEVAGYSAIVPPDPAISLSSVDKQENPKEDIQPVAQIPVEKVEPDVPAVIPPLPPFEPYATAETSPDRMLASTAIMAGGEIVRDFMFPENIDFGLGENYSQIDGITTFRGNNFRSTASFGFADIQNAKFGDKWSITTGRLTAPDGATWTGHGWTGQPLIVKWPKQTREIMNMHNWAKEREELVEVVYASMDGHIYFAELESGAATRDKLFIGYSFKGAGSLDPRGYPLLYVGAGYPSSLGSARIFIISLIDGSVLHTFGNGDRFAPRSWSAADASPLIDAENDKLIYPSENGVLYIVDLNSDFDPVAGTITIDPDEPVKWRFAGRRSQVGGKYWLGIESSPAIWRGHLFLADNGGHLICLDLNTLEPVWVQDVLDDTNCSPVLAIEDGHPYLYISTGFHGGWRAPADESATVPIWKIDAMTGEIVWQTNYFCFTISGISGGVQGTLALGKNGLSDLIFVPVARTPGRLTGKLVALNKHNGEIVWEFQTSTYSWSSPVAVYDKDGKGYIVYCTSGGSMHLIDGLTGELLDSVVLGGVVEASPAVYENTVVIGTRAMRIWGVQIN